MKEDTSESKDGAPFSNTAGDAGLQTSLDLCPKTGTETGLPCIKTWKAAYIFVACTFFLWVALLICLTEMSA